MASFTKKPNGTWLAQVRHKAQHGRPAINESRTFNRKADAQAWASKIENEWQSMRLGLIPNLTFGEVLRKYLKEITPTKRGAKSESTRIARFMKTSLADVMLPDLNSRHFEEWAEKRLKEVGSNSVIREWATLSHVLTVSVEKWKFLPENYMLKLEKPKKPKARLRRISQKEIDKICHAAGYDINNDQQDLKKQIQRVGAAFCFALETAMRAGEIVNLQRQNVFISERYVHLEMTKNGEQRDVPLSKKAIKILNQVMRAHDKKNVFDIPSASLDAQFRQIKKQVYIDDLHFHDTRCEALTRLSKKYTPLELAKISGHKDLRILLNAYYAPTASELAQKME